LNISDDDEDFELSDSDDDLNPSKISEYDEDRAERESVISTQTGYSLQKQKGKLKSKSLNQNPSTEDSHTSSQVSVSDVQKQLDTTINDNTNNNSPNCEPISSPKVASIKSHATRNDNDTDSNHARSTSDYENLSNKPSPVAQRVADSSGTVSYPPPVHPQVNKINNKPFNNNKSPQKSFQFTNILPMKPKNSPDNSDKKPIQSSDVNIPSNFSSNSSSSPQYKQTIPQSQSYIISPNYASTASIMSRPPPQSPTAYIGNRARLKDGRTDIEYI